MNFSDVNRTIDRRYERKGNETEKYGHLKKARLLHDRLKDLVINPEARRHSHAYSGDDEANAFEEGAFYNPNRETSYTVGD